MLEKASARRNTKRTDSHTKTGGSKNEKERGQRRSRRNGAMAAGTIAAAVAMTSVPNTPSASAAPAETVAVALGIIDLPGGRSLEQIKKLQAELPHVHAFDVGRVSRKNQETVVWPKLGVKGEADYRAIMAVNVEKLEARAKLAQA